MGILLALGAYLGSGPGGDGGRRVEDSWTWWQGDQASWFVKDFASFSSEILMFQATPQTRANPAAWSPHLLTRELHSSGVIAGPPLLCDLGQVS